MFGSTTDCKEQSMVAWWPSA